MTRERKHDVWDRYPTFDEARGRLPAVLVRAGDRATERGHILVDDSAGGAIRLSCRKCACAVLTAGGPVYGSAADVDCRVSA